MGLQPSAHSAFWIQSDLTSHDCLVADWLTLCASFRRLFQPVFNVRCLSGWKQYLCCCRASSVTQAPVEWLWSYVPVDQMTGRDPPHRFYSDCLALWLINITALPKPTCVSFSLCLRCVGSAVCWAAAEAGGWRGLLCVCVCFCCCNYFPIIRIDYIVIRWINIAIIVQVKKVPCSVVVARSLFIQLH